MYANESLNVRDRVELVVRNKLCPGTLWPSQNKFLLPVLKFWDKNCPTITNIQNVSFDCENF